MLGLFFELLEQDYPGVNWTVLFEKHLANDQRLGQAFMNTLPNELSNKLIGTIHDPFHRDDLAHIYAAIDFLTTK